VNRDARAGRNCYTRFRLEERDLDRLRVERRFDHVGRFRERGVDVST
jgi:hypothetical protein